MKCCKIIFVFVLLTFVGRTSADNLIVNHVTIGKGWTKKVGFVLKNPSRQYVAFQFDIKLPDGISIANNNKGEVDIILNEERINGHTLTVEDKGSGVYRLLAFSFPVKEFSGTDGDLVYVTLKADKEVDIGELSGKIKSQVFTGNDGIEYKWEDVSFTISVGTNLGDVNSDGELDERDVNAIASYIIGDTPDNFDEEAADVNGDKEINAADIVKLVDLLGN